MITVRCVCWEFPRLRERLLDTTDIPQEPYALKIVILTSGLVRNINNTLFYAHYMQLRHALAV